MPGFFLPPAAYHDGSFDRQKADATVALLEEAEIASASCVLDVGCGAGQTLRLVEGLCDSAMLIGLDPDGEALASGKGMSDRIRFVRGEGERLPFADGMASHIICRVSFNYMHQNSTLRELGRVLAPGGRMIVSTIAVGYSLREVLRPAQGGLRQRLGNLKDLIVGILLHVTGFQAARGTLLGRSVPHTSPWRLRRQLRALGCEVERLAEESSYLGLPTVHWAIVAKAG